MVECAHVHAEQILIKEGQGSMSLLQAGERVFFRLGDVLQEAADVAGRKLAGVPFVVEQDQAARPIGTAVAWAGLAEAGLSDLPDEVEQAGWLGRGSSERNGGRHGDPSLTGNGLFRISVHPNTRSGKQKRGAETGFFLTGKDPEIGMAEVVRSPGYVARRSVIRYLRSAARRNSYSATEGRLCQA